MDYVLNTERLPQKGETLPARDFLKVHGGKGMNQAVAIKRLGDLGITPIMVGCLGKDSDGEELMAALKNESIPRDFIQRSEEIKTGIAFITVSDAGDNTIVVHPGSNHGLTVDWVLDAIAKHRDAKMLVLQMEIPLEVIKATIDQAHVFGIPVVLNPSPFKALPTETLQKVHTLVVNEVEAMQIAESMGDYAATENLSDEHSVTDEEITVNKDMGKKSAEKTVPQSGPESNPGSDTKSDTESDTESGLQSDPENLVAFLASSGIPQVILTLGNRGVYYNDPNSTLVHHQPAKEVNVVDPTAAGDSFLGAYVARRSLSYTVHTSVSYGVLAGALAVTKSGAQPSIPAAEDLHRAGYTE